MDAIGAIDSALCIDGPFRDERAGKAGSEVAAAAALQDERARRAAKQLRSEQEAARQVIYGLHSRFLKPLG